MTDQLNEIAFLNEITDARHYCVNLDAARPVELVPEGELDLLMASPECTHNSRARGGKPIHDQRRMSA